MLERCPVLAKNVITSIFTSNIKHNSRFYILFFFIHKVKAGNVVIALRKAEDGKTWGSITASKRKEKEIQ